MIISHRYRYLFVELPRTGTTAISKELLEHYDGKRILKKHATYDDFLKVATPDEKSYCVIASVRNPLDRIVSLYFKYQSDHRGQYSSNRLLNKQNFFVQLLRKKQFDYVHNKKASFQKFFTRFYRVPFDDWTALNYNHFDIVIRFENINDDFKLALNELGIEPVRALPLVNKTSERDSDFWTYYTPDIRNHARWVFGPYLERWNYEFPAEWGSEPLPWSSRAAHTISNIPRKLYWKYYR